MKNKTVVIIIILVLGAAFSISRFAKFGKVTTSPVVEDKEKVFKPAPEFTLSDAYGTIKKLSDYKGKIVILDFWATWCPPCKAEIPHFRELYEKYKDDGLEVIGVALDWNADRILQPFIEQNGINYTILIGNRDITDAYGGIISMPTTFVIDRLGGIRKKYIGYKDKQVFERDIKELL